MLNGITLAPGDALFLPAGELHCYLHGTAIELMANSDNVLLGGLTPKHVDVPELLPTLTFRAVRVPVLRPHESAPGEAVYDTSVLEFQLSVLRPQPGHPVACDGSHSPAMLFCSEGEAVLVDEGQGDSLQLRRGQAGFVPAAVSHYHTEGSATLHRAGVPG